MRFDMGGEGWYVLERAMGTKQTSPLSDRSSREHSDDPACCVRIDMAAVLGDGVLCGTSLQDCVSRYNRDNESNLTLKRAATILMPGASGVLFLQADRQQDRYARQELVGGFAESKILQSSVLSY
jgi:hypothetical protein